MTDNLQNTIKDEVISRGAEAAGKVAGKALDKTIEISVGLFGKKKSIELSFSMLFRFYDSPQYDTVVVGFENMLGKYRIPPSKEMLSFNNRRYLQTLSIRETTDPVIPLVANDEDRFELEQFLTAMVRSSSAVLYLAPIVSEQLSFDELSSLMKDTLTFSKEFRHGLENLIRIKNSITFCKITVYSLQMTELMDRLRRSMPTIEATVESDEKRSVKVQLTDSSIIDELIGALEKSL